MPRRRPDLEAYRERMHSFKVKFVWAWCALNGINPPRYEDIPAPELTDFLREADGRIINPWRQWQRALDVIQYVETFKYNIPLLKCNYPHVLDGEILPYGHVEWLGEMKGDYWLELDEYFKEVEAKYSEAMEKLKLNHRLELRKKSLSGISRTMDSRKTVVKNIRLALEMMQRALAGSFPLPPQIVR